MDDGRPKVGGLREDGLTGSVKGGRPTRAASLAKAADGAGIVGAISKFLARTPPQKKAKVTADVEMTTFSSTTTSPAATSSSSSASAMVASPVTSSSSRLRVPAVYERREKGSANSVMFY